MKQLLVVALVFGSSVMAQGSPPASTVAYVSLREVATAFQTFMGLDSTAAKQPRLTVAGVAHTLPVGSTKAFLVSGQTITLAGPVVTQAGVTYVPARFFASLGCAVNASQGRAASVNISCKNPQGANVAKDFARLAPSATVPATAAPATRAAAAPVPVLRGTFTAVNADQLGAVLKELGYAFKRLTDDDGDAYFEIMMGDFDKIYLDLYSCDKGNCQALQLYTSFDKGGKYPSAKIVEWNHDYFTQAYLTDNGNPGVSDYTKLMGGVTLDYIKTFIKDFQSTAEDFAKFVDF